VQILAPALGETVMFQVAAALEALAPDGRAGQAGVGGPTSLGESGR
jgi:hypothetical protein